MLTTLTIAAPPHTYRQADCGVAAEGKAIHVSGPRTAWTLPPNSAPFVEGADCLRRHSARPAGEAGLGNFRRRERASDRPGAGAGARSRQAHQDRKADPRTN